MSLIGHVVTVLLPCQGLLFNNVDISDDKIFLVFYSSLSCKDNLRLNQGPLDADCVMLFSPLDLVQWLMYSPSPASVSRVTILTSPALI